MTEMRKEVSVSVFAVLIVAATFLTVYYLGIGPTGFAIFQQNTNASFNEGAYSNALYNGSAIVLDTSANATSGIYTSKILDANSSVTWNNLTWQGGGVTFQVRNCTAADCSDANFISVSDLNNLNLTGRYFQYKASFDSANDSLGGVTVDYTVQQVTPISVSISQPTGEKSSLSAIPLQFAITGGTGNNLTCLYNVYFIDVAVLSNTSINCTTGTNTQTFDLADEGGDNTLTIYARDTSGSTSASSAFTINIPEESSEELPEEVIPEALPVAEIPTVTQISLGAITSQDINQGNSGQFTVSVQNTGTVPVTSCVLNGDDSGWIANAGGAQNINPGESATFSFSVNVPEDASVEAHTLGFSVDCSEVTASQTLSVNVLQKKLDFNITNVQRTREDRVRVDYALAELAGEDQDLQIFFSITDSSGLQVANTSQNSSIDANETDDFRVNIPINETLEGNLTLSAAFNSQVYSSSVLEPISLGAPIGGFAIFEGIGGAGGFIVLVVVVLVLVTVFFIARRLRQSGKSLGDLLHR